MSAYTIAKYLRLSLEDKNIRTSGKPESDSISNQRDLLDSYIRKIPEFSEAAVLEFCDDGWSGKNFDRPAVQKMLQQARQGKIQCIIVKDMSRFGRDYLIVGNYISRVFPFLGVRFIAVNDGIDSIRPNDIDSLDTSFKALLYDLYSRDLSRKVRSAKKLRAQQGNYFCTYAPYGYQKDPHQKNHLIVDPPAAEIVRRIFQMVADGYSAIQTAKILNQEGVPTPMCYKQAAGCTRMVWNSIQDENFWTNSIIIKTIRNECYLGKVLYGKRFYDEIGKEHSIKVSKTDWVIVPDVHEKIVTQEEFDRAQAALRNFTERSTASKPIRRKICCGVCGHAMVYAHTCKHPYYYCRTSRITDAFSCTEERLDEQELLEVLLESLQIQAAAAIEFGRIWDEKHRHEKINVKTIEKKLSKL